jgi:hypothetical protein
MTEIKIDIDINTVTTHDILQVYSGRPGCGCGCRGKYRYNPANLEEAKANAGARILEKSDFNAAQVKKTLDLMKQHPNELKWDTTVVAWETKTRYYWAYFTQAFIDNMAQSDKVLYIISPVIVQDKTHCSAGCPFLQTRDEDPEMENPRPDFCSLGEAQTDAEVFTKKRPHDEIRAIGIDLARDKNHVVLRSDYCMQKALEIL